MMWKIIIIINFDYILFLKYIIGWELNCIAGLNLYREAAEGAWRAATLGESVTVSGTEKMHKSQCK